MITRRTALKGAAIAATAAIVHPTSTGAAGAQDAPVSPLASESSGTTSLERQKIELTAPPFVHSHEQAIDKPPRIMEVTLTIQEKEVVIDEAGTKMQAMTYNGSIPGPFMVVHVDDYVELTLVNPPTNQLTHNIDFHAATGALGGGGLTLVNPGQQVILRWKATRPGVFVYHCAPGGVMIPWHVVSGMSGAIMVLPRKGLTDGNGKPLRYDRAYFIGENDFYIPRDEEGNFKSYASPLEAFGETIEVMRKLVPSHIVFNGKVGALTGDNALPAKVGETVLIVHSQANRDTRPHLIGGHGDHVWQSGKFSNAPDTNLETWFVRGGSAAAALYTFLEPGLYAYVNHNLIEAVLLGATAHLKVEGEWNNDLMQQVAAPASIPGHVTASDAAAP
jgi:nitrite reductase (NO-forming)